MKTLFNTYKGGLSLAVSGLIFGVIGVTFFNTALSSSTIAIFFFVSIVIGMGLCGALIVGRTFYRRHDPFKKTR